MLRCPHRKHWDALITHHIYEVCLLVSDETLAHISQAKHFLWKGSHPSDIWVQRHHITYVANWDYPGLALSCVKVSEKTVICPLLLNKTCLCFHLSQVFTDFEHVFCWVLMSSLNGSVLCFSTIAMTLEHAGTVAPQSNLSIPVYNKKTCTQIINKIIRKSKNDT